MSFLYEYTCCLCKTVYQAQSDPPPKRILHQETERFKEDGELYAAGYEPICGPCNTAHPDVEGLITA